MIEIEVRLLFETKLKEISADRGVRGFWVEDSFNITEEDLIEKFNLDEEDLYDVNGEIRDYGDLNQDGFNKIEIALNEGSLPVGITACTEFGLPAYVYFINMEVVESDNNL